MTSPTDAAPDRAAAQAHLKAGRYASAAKAYRALVEIEPHAPNLRYDLGAALAASGDEEGAADAWSTARVFHGLALLRELGVDMDRFASDPDYAVETGRSLAANGLPGVAGAALARAIEARGPQLQILADYAVCLLHQGAVEEACEVLAMAEDEESTALGPLLMAAYGYFDDGGLRRSLLARQAGAQLEDGVTQIKSSADLPYLTAGRPLKVGYIPGAAPLEARFLAVIARHDPEAVEAVLLLDDVDSAPEGFTAFSIAGLPDQEAAEAVATFGLDVLVDLSGPAGGRLGLFARRPAPVQLSWNCDLAGTGLTTLDGKLMPAGCIEPDAAMLFSENLMPMGPVLAPWPQVQLSPRPPAARFTFGAFMPPAMMSKDTIAALARAVAFQPDSRLMLKHAVMDDPVIQRTLAARFLAAGLSREQLEFRGMAGPELDQADFDEVDLALDGRPSMGEAQVLALLARGVPVLCAGGVTTRGRLVLAPLLALGLRELATDNLDHLVARALELSDNPAALAALRGRIEKAFENSAYGDATAVARNLEGAYRKAVGERSAVARKIA
jgi:tetratricopeptide (TPR) repeat protein